MPGRHEVPAWPGPAYNGRPDSGPTSLQTGLQGLLKPSPLWSYPISVVLVIVTCEWPGSLRPPSPRCESRPPLASPPAPHSELQQASPRLLLPRPDPPQRDSTSTGASPQPPPDPTTTTLASALEQSATTAPLVNRRAHGGRAATEDAGLGSELAGAKLHHAAFPTRHCLVCVTPSTPAAAHGSGGPFATCV